MPHELTRPKFPSHHFAPPSIGKSILLFAVKHEDDHILLLPLYPAPALCRNR